MDTTIHLTKKIYNNTELQHCSIDQGNFIQLKIPLMKTIPIHNSDIVSTDILQQSFKQLFNFKSFNYIQSVCFQSVFYTDENILISAPTGTGKTNIALLSVLKESENKHSVKVFYIAPMKSLAHEIYSKFKPLLYKIGLKSEECTGDTAVRAIDLEHVNFVVCTPEKLDLIIRRNPDFLRNVDLLIFDEVHLLDTARGSVIESIVSSAHKISQYSRKTRLVALSATLPNPEDVALFLHVDTGLFVFGDEIKKVPISKTIIGAQEKNIIKRDALMKAILQINVKNVLNKEKQVLIFVHSRKETLKIASYLSSLFRMTSTVRERFTNPVLLRLAREGFGIHHAGLTKQDRHKTESLFERKVIKVLVSTSTLAWGVNLPAHTVIIYNTKIYSPERGGMVHIDKLDVLQMFGRAGRPQFDTSGDSILITETEEIAMDYLNKLLYQTPIESNLIDNFNNILNALISSQTTRTYDEVIYWLDKTFFSVRLSRNPLHYGALNVYDNYEFKNSLISNNLDFLTKNKLIKTNNEILCSTETGKIFSNYYLNIKNVDVLGLMENIFDYTFFLYILSQCHEFKQIKEGEDGVVKLNRVLNELPFVPEEGIDSEGIKVIIIVQLIMLKKDPDKPYYIRKLNLYNVSNNFYSDYNYIEQNINRIVYALYLLAVAKNLFEQSILCLNFYRMLLLNKRIKEANLGLLFDSDELRNKSDITRSLKSIGELNEEQKCKLFKNRQDSNRILTTINRYPLFKYTNRRISENRHLVELIFKVLYKTEIIVLIKNCEINKIRSVKKWIDEKTNKIDINLFNYKEGIEYNIKIFRMSYNDSEEDIVIK